MKFALGKKLAIVALVLGILALPLASFAAGNEGAELYKSAKPSCAMCHGPDAKGKLAGTKDLGSAEVQKQSDAELTDIITKGKPPKMPAFKDKLSADQIKSLVAYIRSLKK